MKKAKKRLVREALIARAKEAFTALYHNGTIHWPSARDLPEDIEKYFPAEAQWECLSDHFSMTLEYINHSSEKSSDYIEQYISRVYGKVYCYGRGGRTVGPTSWFRSTGGSGFGIVFPDFDEMPRRRILCLLQHVEEWNAYVSADCSAASIKDMLYNTYLDRKGEILLEESRKLLDEKAGSPIAI